MQPLASPDQLGIVSLGNIPGDDAEELIDWASGEVPVLGLGGVQQGSHGLDLSCPLLPQFHARGHGGSPFVGWVVPPGTKTGG